MTTILSNLGIKTNNDKILASLGFVLFIPILLDFFAALTFGNNRVITIMVYSVSFVITFLVGKKKITLSSFPALLFIYAVFIINWLLNPNISQYIDIPQYMIFAYYLPLGFLIFRNIDSWDNFVRILFLYTPFAILIGLYVIFFSEITTLDRMDTYVTYMEFSYALLPFVCATFAYYNQSGNIFSLVLFICGLAEMLSFGCRGAMLFSIVFAFISRFFIYRRRIGLLIFLSIILFIVFINIDSIFNALSNVSIFSNSYILHHAMEGDVFEHNSRELIFANCKNRIAGMGLEISGLFGDREYCGSVYPHNIVYEVLMQWGWVLGGVFLLYLAVLFIKGFLRNNTSNVITLYFCCAILFKFLVSDSYIQNGLFWIMIACMINVSKAPKQTV